MGDEASAAGGGVEVWKRWLEGWPVEYVETEDAGRTLVASRNIKAGELVLASKPTGITLLPHARKRWCGHCAGFTPSDQGGRSSLPFGCRACGMHFCCEACMIAAEECVHSDEACEVRTELSSLSNCELDR